MANLIRPEAADDLARRLSNRIYPLQARARIQHLFACDLRDDPLNARPLTLGEAIDAPLWARRALAAGFPVYAFEPHPASVQRLRRAARAVRAASAELASLSAIPPAMRDGQAEHVRREALELFAKLDRMTLPAIVSRARLIAAQRARRQRERLRARQLFPRQEAYAAPGRVWRRLVSIADLAQIGARLHNCLAAGSERHADYARQLRSETATFWALFDQNDTPLAVVKVDVASARITEAGGPFNAKLAANDPLLLALVRWQSLNVPTGLERWAIAPQLSGAEPLRLSQVDQLTDAELAALVESIIGHRPQGVLRR